MGFAVMDRPRAPRPAADFARGLRAARPGAAGDRPGARAADLGRRHPGQPTRSARSLLLWFRDAEPARQARWGAALYGVPASGAAADGGPGAGSTRCIDPAGAAMPIPRHEAARRPPNRRAAPPRSPRTPPARGGDAVAACARVIAHRHPATRRWCSTCSRCRHVPARRVAAAHRRDRRSRRACRVAPRRCAGSPCRLGSLAIARCSDLAGTAFDWRARCTRAMARCR